MTATRPELIGGSAAGPRPKPPPTSPRPSLPQAFIVLMVIYFVLSLTGSADAYLSSDVGGKTAALEAMVDRGDWNPDLGYWAEASDPEGVVFPFANTTKTENGKWVNTTSLPMVLAARPLWAIGGARLALLIPMAAAAGAALVAGRLQQRLDPAGRSSAVWVVGLATPVAVYALDFWEHSLGVFLMGFGVLLLVESIDRRSMGRALGAGAAFGLAATMRQEALVYGFVAGTVLAVELFRGRSKQQSWSRDVLICGSMAFGAVAMLVANAVAEIVLYGASLRSGRTVGATASAGNNIGDRVDAAFTITLSPLNGIDPIATGFGIVILAGLTWLLLAVLGDHDRRAPAALLIAIATVLLLRVARFGPSFVPGMVPAAPLVVAGAVLGIRSGAHRTMAVIALAPVPLVYLTQYVQGAVPQWGGRYLLFTGFLLVVVACSLLPVLDRAVFTGLVVAGLFVTSTGIWFNAERTNLLADDFELIDSVANGDVVVWYDPFMAREAGPAMLEQRWLSSVGDRERVAVLDVLHDEAVDRFVYIDRIGSDPASFGGFVAVSDIGEWELSPVLDQRLTIFTRR